MRKLREDLYAVRGWLGWTHLLVSDGEVVLVDTGLSGECGRIQAAIRRLGFPPRALTAILLTHGHVDHTANAARLQDWSGAQVYAPIGDEQHVAGAYPYRGAARLCGALEWLGRRLLRYRPPRVDGWLREGDRLPHWGGLRVVTLPGHTAGQVGFHSEAKKLCFVGDAFALSWRVALPPALLSTDVTAARRSFLKLAQLPVDSYVPCHYLKLPADTPARVRRRAARLNL
jgi:glyoxylase-like metal-dependent hydrolase (beta-lactamase superfamily II)